MSARYPAQLTAYQALLDATRALVRALEAEDLEEADRLILARAQIVESLPAEMTTPPADERDRAAAAACRDVLTECQQANAEALRLLSAARARVLRALEQSDAPQARQSPYAGRGTPGTLDRRG